MRAVAGVVAVVVVWLVAVAPARAAGPGWEAVVERVAGAVLAIRVDAVRDFDTGVASSSQATGFVVDAERGIVLTNRHVVQPGPVVATGAFLNREEVVLRPIYRDPVHDFGFFQYDPAALKYNRPEALPLRPDRAQLGREIRVIGNDSGEQLSILAGTLSRLDRPAPRYRHGGYNDFNTFYIQAASSTSGGSSGAPVVDRDGNVVALNAGANSNSASSFYLPLERVVRALERIRAGAPVERGTLQATFRYQPYEELRRLGLSDEQERAARQRDPGATGLLTVSSTVPEGPADGVLEAGDIVLRVAGRWVRDFVDLEALLDERVGRPLAIEVVRGGRRLELEVTVGDLHAITPAAYLTVGGAVLHTLSYQQARNFNLPVRGLFVARAGYMLGNEDVARGDVITAIDGEPVAGLADAEALLERIGHGARFTITFFGLSNPRQSLQRVVTMDRRWFEAATCHRDDASGLWPCRPWAEPPEAPPPRPATTRFPGGDPLLEALAPSLVVVDFDIPYPVEGIVHPHYIGNGLIVDAERGWVLVDRNTVPGTLGDVRLIFAASLEVPGRVEYIHPFHNFAIVSYDPVLIGDTAVREARFDTTPLRVGDGIWLVGPKASQRLTRHRTTVADIDNLFLPLPNVPRFREANQEVITLASSIATIGGVLADDDGAIRALWTSLQYQNGKQMSQMEVGVPAEQIVAMLERLRAEGFDARFPDIGAELQVTTLAQARKRGLPEAWALEIERHDPLRRGVLHVVRRVAGSAAAEVLRDGDLLLAVDGATVSTFRQVERAIDGRDAVEVTLLRQGRVERHRLPVGYLGGEGLERVVLWAGAVLHRPHRAIAAQRGFADPGLYLSWSWLGSPAAHYGVGSTLRLVALDGHPVTDVDTFLAALRQSRGRDSVRLKVLDLAGRARALTLRPDDHYWPTVELRKEEAGWRRLRPLDGNTP